MFVPGRNNRTAAGFSGGLGPAATRWSAIWSNGDGPRTVSNRDSYIPGAPLSSRGAPLGTKSPAKATAATNASCNASIAAATRLTLRFISAFHRTSFHRTRAVHFRRIQVFAVLADQNDAPGGLGGVIHRDVHEATFVASAGRDRREPAAPSSERSEVMPAHRRNSYRESLPQ